MRHPEMKAEKRNEAFQLAITVIVILAAVVAVGMFYIRY